MIFHIPHASTNIPLELRGSFVISDDDLENELLLMTDHFTDDLFLPAASPEDTTLLAEVSRLVVDVERFDDDEIEVMAKQGMGVVYTQTQDGQPLRDPTAERDELLKQYYYPHHVKLNQMVSDELGNSGSSFIIDCHSFPSKPLPYESDQSRFRPDFCIGTDPHHTPSDIVELVVDYLTNEGYTVSINRPFAGCVIPGDSQGSDEVFGMMIEINRSLYMDESSGKRIADFARTQSVVKGMVEIMRVWAESAGDFYEVLNSYGDEVASQDWDSGGPGAGAGTTSLYEMFGRYYQTHDAGYEKYQTLIEATSSSVFYQNDATESISVGHFFSMPLTGKDRDQLREMLRIVAILENDRVNDTPLLDQVNSAKTLAELKDWWVLNRLRN
jgi:N-formylglutamate deformylase